MCVNILNNYHIHAYDAELTDCLIYKFYQCHNIVINKSHFAKFNVYEVPYCNEALSCKTLGVLASDHSLAVSR